MDRTLPRISGGRSATQQHHCERVQFVSQLFVGKPGESPQAAVTTVKLHQLPQQGGIIVSRLAAPPLPGSAVDAAPDCPHGEFVSGDAHLAGNAKPLQVADDSVEHSLCGGFMLVDNTLLSLPACADSK